MVTLSHLFAEIVYNLYAFDMVEAAKTRSQAFLMFMHHVVGSYGFLVMLYFGGHAFTLNYLLLAVEYSNTNNHIRMFL